MIRTLFLSSIIFLSLSLFSQVDGFTYSDSYAAFEAEEYQKASEILNSLIAEENKAEYYVLRGDCFHKMEEFESALADYNFAKQLKYENDELILNRGICKISLSMLDEGREDISTYLGEHEESAVAWYYLAVISYLQYENKESITYLNLALNYNSEYMEALYLKAANHAELKKWNQAASTYEQALEINPDFHRIQMNLALIKMELNEYEEAIEILDKLRMIDVDFLNEIYFYRAEAKYSMHDKAGACEDWKEAAELGDEDAASNIKNICEKGNKRLKKRRATFAEF